MVHRASKRPRMVTQCRRRRRSYGSSFHPTTKTPKLYAILYPKESLWGKEQLYTLGFLQNINGLAVNRKRSQKTSNFLLFDSTRTEHYRRWNSYKWKAYKETKRMVPKSRPKMAGFVAGERRKPTVSRVSFFFIFFLFFCFFFLFFPSLPRPVPSS